MSSQQKGSRFESLRENFCVVCVFFFAFVPKLYMLAYLRVFEWVCMIVLFVLFLNFILS